MSTYHRKIIGFAVLGTGYVTLVVLAYLALTACGIFGIGFGFYRGGLLAGLVFFPLPAFAVYLAGSQLVRILRSTPHEYPHVRIEPEVAPRLHDSLETVREILDVPAVDEVILTAQFNASIRYIPRLGWLGWPRTRLVLGLPLLDVLTTDEFRALLAHELAHLTDERSALLGWSRHRRTMWLSLASATDSRPENEPPVLIGRFALWFVPWFDDFLGDLCRSTELDADARSADVTDPDTAARGLGKSAAGHQYLMENFYSPITHPQLAEASEEDWEPYLETYRQRLRDALDKEGDALLQRALDSEDPSGRPHPPLSERLESLDIEDISITPLGDDFATDYYLQELLPDAAGTLNDAISPG